MSTCNKDHRSDPYFARLPVDQGDFGRHKCAGCAYEAGYQRGINRCMSIDMETDFQNLPESQADAVRHKSPYVAYAQGYANGLFDSY
ncbi:TPA: hypothetical protein RXG61_004018 [Escherichia coli]|uniref:hypothetical protein n=1 Tax=Enterobacteriaceae TaxID=543 RepID=UPI00243379CB|nr:hypothetical protein [Escherichia marmotae]WFZ17266.1 hypothetical protein NFK54_24155 [Escherichia marmotae]HDN0682443.1 hypothetical protein [Escherichia coli]HEA6317564.1 hypothetical protein [Escherichia coli]HEA6336940.1 hypothetical protein [Escherichia coli]